jgi:aspartate ammonia-lyase
MVKRAAAEANLELSLIDEARANAIIQAAQELIDGKWDAEFVVDVFQAGAGVSFHMNTNEVKSIISIARKKKLLSEEEIGEILDPARMTEPQYPLDSARLRDRLKEER